MPKATPDIVRRSFAEVLGTFILVFFGCGAVHAAVLVGAHSGLWQVAIVWGIAIMVACYLFGGISGAHINPAITIALAAWGRFPRGEVLPYVLCQLAGAYIAACALFVFYEPFLAVKETSKGVERGAPGSEITAMCYGEFYPNPGAWAAGDTTLNLTQFQASQSPDRFPLWRAFVAELLGTGVLGLVVFSLTDERNRAVPERLAPVFIGLTVAVLIAVIAPLTQACFNPARDIGPRLFASMAGWGKVALPGPRGWEFLLVYVGAPVAGALLGGGLYVQRVGKDLPGVESR